MASGRPVINWLKKCPELKGYVKDQEHRCNCWALATGWCVGARHGMARRIGLKPGWLLSAQYLMDDFIRDQPDDVPVGSNGRMARDDFNNYPLDTRRALDYVRQHGMPYESHYKYTGERDLSEEKKDTTNFQKVFISRYSELGSTNDGEAAKERIYEGLLRGPVLASIELSHSFSRHRGDHVLRPEDIESGSEYIPGSDDSSGDDSTGSHASDDPGPMAHAIVIVGMDYGNNFFFILNSQGLSWGDEDGVGKVGCDLIFDILEPDVNDERNRGLRGPVSLASSYTPKQIRALKHLGKAIPDKCLATGPAAGIKGFFSDVKPALLRTLDAEDEKNPFEKGSAAPKKIVKVADTSSSASGGGPDSLPQEDSCCGKITPALLKGLESSDWKTCTGCIEAVNKILEEANKHVQPTVESFGKLRGLLCVRHQNLIMATLSTIGGIASTMGPGIEKASKEILSDVLKCLGDNKNHMRECTLTTLVSWFAHAHLDKMCFTGSHKSLLVLGSVGEPINPAWRWFCNVIGDSRCPISNKWWQTETGGFMIASLPGALPWKPGSATFPFFGVQPAIVDDEGSGSQTLYGDHKRYETAYFKHFPGNYFRGDGCRRDKDAYYWLIARENDAINVRYFLMGYITGSATFPFFGVQPAIVDDEGSGSQTLYGDHKRYETAYFKHFPGNYFRGDGCRRDKDAYYWLIARENDAINVSGHRISAAEVESALFSHTQCTGAAVVAGENEVEGQGIYAFVTLVEGVQQSEELRKSLILAVKKKMEHLQLLTRSNGHLDFPRLEAERSLKFLTCPT